MQNWAASQFQAAFRAAKKRTAMGMAKRDLGMSADEAKALRFKQMFSSKINQSRDGLLESPRRAPVQRLAAPPKRSQPQGGGNGSEDHVMIEMSTMLPTMGTVASPLTSPTPVTNHSPSTDPNAAAIEITEVRNLFRDRANKRKKAKATKGIGPASPGGVVQL